MGQFSPVVPTALLPYCSAIQFRFARSMSQQLKDLWTEVECVLGEDLPCASKLRGRLPYGGVCEAPLLNNLLDAAKLDGSFIRLRTCVSASPANAWILDPAIPSPRGSSVQTGAYLVFKSSVSCNNIQVSLENKLRVTFGDEIFAGLSFPAEWTSTLFKVLAESKPFSKMCLFKTYMGGWTTTVRMTGSRLLGCPFGCPDSEDSIRHYLFCTPLWHFAGEALGAWAPLEPEQRLCIDQPSVQSVQTLALIFVVYHHLKDKCKSGEAWLPQHFVHQVAQNAIRVLVRRVMWLGMPFVLCLVVFLFILLVFLSCTAGVWMFCTAL